MIDSLLKRTDPVVAAALDHALSGKDISIDEAIALLDSTGLEMNLVLTVADELSFQLNKPVRVHVAAEADIDRALDLVSGRAVGLLAPEDEAREPPVLEPASELPSPSSAKDCICCGAHSARGG